MRNALESFLRLLGDDFSDIVVLVAVAMTLDEMRVLLRIAIITDSLAKNVRVILRSIPPLKAVH